ncbi:hypothetical protein GGI07_004976 [Coemansia sp. Benny D115]|nr:hypothetical protein GGI07_004976 [Coemansia sp. Benny D115]
MAAGYELLGEAPRDDQLAAAQQSRLQFQGTLHTVDLNGRLSIADSPPGSPCSDTPSQHSDGSLTPSCQSTVLLVSKKDKLAAAHHHHHHHHRRSCSGSSCETSNHAATALEDSCYGAESFELKEQRMDCHVRRALSFIGLFFTIFLSGLDQTITATILTRIANDFRALDHIEWVPTIFMLCSTSLNIVSGRVADIFGRIPVLLFSLVAFSTGAVVAASSQSMVVFIVARGISGIACGGMLNLSIIIISDIVPIERRGRYLGFLQICFGASSAAGPLVGGLFADHFSWRAAFFADMIMGIISVIYLAAVLRLPKPETLPGWKLGIRSFDFVGVSTIVASVSLVIVGLNIGGTMYSWSSPVTITCLTLGCVLLGVFVGVELKVPRLPLVPMWFFTVRNLVISFAVTFLCGMTMFSMVFYMPVYFSAVFGANAMRAGLLVLPFGVALSVSSFVTGYFMSAMSRYRLFLRMGPATMAVGVLLLALLSGRTSQSSQAALLLIPGIGMGNVIVANVIAAQASTDPQYIATITPLCEFFLSIGGVIGVSIFGAVYRNKLASILTARALGESPVVQALINEARKDVSVAYAHDVSDPVRSMIASAYSSSMKQALWVMLPLLVLASILALFLEKNPQKQSPQMPVKEAAVPREPCSPCVTISEP